MKQAKNLLLPLESTSGKHAASIYTKNAMAILISLL
ncbi:Uncharacterised protein [Legionella lansingensis]|nr:Uncharacterised protein [Legionella lansingensis]